MACRFLKRINLKWYCVTCYSHTRKGCDMDEKYIRRGNAGYEANLILGEL